METFSALLAICAGNSPVIGEFPAQRPVMRSFDVFFNLHLNNRLSKQSWGWWFETPLWCHCNVKATTRHNDTVIVTSWCPFDVPIMPLSHQNEFATSFWLNNSIILYHYFTGVTLTRWRHQMETFSALLAIYAGNSQVPEPVMRSFHVFFDLHLNNRLSKQWWGWWFETL